MKNLKLLTGAALLSAAVVGNSSLNSGDEYVVIVNSTNELSGSDIVVKDQIKNIFLKQKLEWRGGQSSVPFLASDNSETFQTFLEEVLEMSPEEYERHWVKQKNVSGISPPKQIRSERLLARMVSQLDGAVGIVKKSTIKKAKLEEKVRPILSFK